MEKLSGTGGSVRWNNYIMAADGMVAVYFEIVAGSGTSAVRYFHMDNLGSVAVVTDEPFDKLRSRGGGARRRSLSSGRRSRTRGTPGASGATPTAPTTPRTC